MTVSRPWKQAYALLDDFVAAHNEIVITPSEVSIPKSVRDEFYERFDNVRSAVVEDQYSALPAKIGTLSENYLQAEKAVRELLGLEDIIVPTDLRSFLHNPKDGLVRALYNRMFDLVQGKIASEEFEKQAESDLRSAAADLFRLGYEMWASLIMIQLLEPDQAFLVDLDEDYKPFLRELKDISFGRQAHHPTLRIPEFVLHSRRLNKYVAVKMALAREIETFVERFKPPVRPKKKTGDTSFVLDSRVMLLSFMATPSEIPILADIYELTLTSPDWIIEYATGDELRNPDALDLVKQHQDALRPRLGMCLILADGDETGLEKIPDNIRVISAGFDRSKLLSVVDGLLPLES